MSGELPPVRCMTCNKILADKWNRYQEMLESGVSIENALNKLGLRRPCCRLRLMNPFKYAEKVEPLDDNLYNARNTNVPTMAALSYAAIPENEEISLPQLPELVPLPPSQEQKKVTRIYEAW